MDVRAKELEDALKRVKAAAADEQSEEANRIRDHFTKFVARLEEENKSVKEKVREYEMKVHDLEVENSSLAGENKELVVFKDENANRLISLNERVH